MVPPAAASDEPPGRSPAGTTAEPKGREAVEAALIDAAAELLAERGPDVGVREIASRAGVNHGQIHHYFGSKDALVAAAVRQLAVEHLDNATARARGGALPPPLSLEADDGYWRAVLRLLLDGRLDLAAIEVDEGLSVPRRALLALAAAEGDDQPTTELKARTAASTALQLAWAVLEDFVCLQLDVADDERERVRAFIAGLSVRVLAPLDGLDA